MFAEISFRFSVRPKHYKEISANIAEKFLEYYCKVNIAENLLKNC